MELTTASFVRIDLPAPPAALFATRARARPGNLLMLRRHSLTGDAIPHSVLPGIVLGFLLGGQIRCSLLIAAAYAVGG